MYLSSGSLRSDLVIRNQYLLLRATSSDKKLGINSFFPKPEHWSLDTRRDSRDSFLLIQSAQLVVLGSLLFTEKFGIVHLKSKRYEKIMPEKKEPILCCIFCHSEFSSVEESKNHTCAKKSQRKDNNKLLLYNLVT